MELKRIELPARSATRKDEESNLQSDGRLIPGTPGRVLYKKVGGNSRELGKRMFEEFDEIPFEAYHGEASRKKTVFDFAKAKTLPGHEAHHILPLEMKKHPVLEIIGMDMNDPQNGIALPRATKEEIHALSIHRGYHNVYNDAVKEQLDEIFKRCGASSVETLEKEVYELQKKLRGALENGTPMYGKKKGSDGYRSPSQRKEIEGRGGGATLELWQKILNK